MSHSATMLSVDERLPLLHHAPHQSCLADAFRKLVDWAWWHTSIVFLVFLGSITAVFAAIYYAAGPYICPTEENSTATTDFTDNFFYSVAVTTTLLQARCIPLESDVAMIAANVHSFIIVISTVFLTGVVFTRMTAPGMSISVSDRLILNYNDPSFGPVLKTRFFFNDLKNSLINVKISIQFTRRIRSDFVKIDALKLLREDVTLLLVGTTIIHQINEESPLYGMTLEELAKRRGWFVLTIQGTEATTMQTVFFSKPYFAAANTHGNDGVINPTAEIVDGREYNLKSMMGTDKKSGRLGIDLRNISDIVPISKVDDVEESMESNHSSKATTSISSSTAIAVDRKEQESLQEKLLQ